MPGDDEPPAAAAQSAPDEPQPPPRDELPVLKTEEAPPAAELPVPPSPPPRPPSLPADAEPPPPEPVAEDAQAAPLTEEQANNRPLNVTDALGYLDCVKQQFANQTDVYNRFLDIMKDFKSQYIDTPGVIERVSMLFRGYPMLIQGFNTFLPAGYRIECTVDADNTDLITVTTPAGTTTQSIRDMFPPAREPDVPMTIPMDMEAEADIERALSYVQRVKTRYANDPEKYKAFLEILSPGEIAGEHVIMRVQRLFKDDPDLVKGFYHFLPDRSLQQRMAARLDEMEDSAPLHAESRHARKKQEPPSQAAKAPSVPQKRKRKPAEKEKAEDKEKHKDVVAKAGPSKRTKQQHPASEAPSPSHAHMHPITPSPLRAHAQPSSHLHQPLQMQGTIPTPSHHAHLSVQRPDDAQFFDRVKRALDNRETYNEFLKVVNLFTQDIIDTARLIRESRTYLGDGELLAQFKEILGWDERRERFAGAEDVWTRPTGVLDRPSRNQLNTRYGSYRKLPASEMNVVCSGRDEMCKSVLNDEWVSQPTFASEDGAFIAHKKNAYEEALHRSEEERHEYDFHIEAIHRTIQALEPYNNKINQLSPEEKANYKFKPSLQGASKSIHLRVIKKVYGKEAGVEVFQAMQEVPVVAIPLVLQRLKQKHDEWKRAQREWNKAWKEVDARNYHKSLDHQGVTFKAADKKALTARAFVGQIEAARDEQRAHRAALIDPLFARTRPRHQLEYVVEDVGVLQDALKLVCAYLDRTQDKVPFADRRKIEAFLRAFVPLFFMLDPGAFNAPLVPKQDGAAPGEPDEPPPDDADAAASARRAIKSAGGDLRKRLLKAEQAKSSRRTRAQDAGSPASSRPASPALSEAVLMDVDPPPAENGQPPAGPSAASEARPTRKGTFFTNTHFYVLFRLLEVLYSRLHLFKELCATMSTDPDEPFKSNPLAERLGLLADVAKLGDRMHDASFFYELTLESCEKLFDNELDQNAFEEQLRYMFGIHHAYKLFTIDKVAGSIVKQVQTLLTDAKSQDLYDLLQRERNLPNPTTQDLINLRKNTEKVLGPDENLFRMSWLPDSKTVMIQLLGKDDSNDEDSEVTTGRWQAYVDSYVSQPGETAGLTLPVVRMPFLKRTLRGSPDDNVEGDDNALAMRICVRTYRLFYVAHTEEVLWRRCLPDELAAASSRLKAHNARKRKWLEKFTARDPPPASTANAADSPAEAAKSA